MKKLFYVFYILFFFKFAFAEDIATQNLQIDELKTPLAISKSLDICIENGEELTPNDFFQNNIQKIQSNCKMRKANDEIPSLGYAKTRVWIPINLNINSKIDNLYLEYAFPAMQFVSLYEYEKESGLVEKKETGKALPFNSRTIENRNFIFKLDKIKNGTYTGVLMLKCVGSLQVPLYLHTSSTLFKKIQGDNLFYGFYYGIIIIMAVYNLFLFLFFRNKSYLYYILYILSLGLAQSTLTGNAIVLIWSEFHLWNKISTVFLIGTTYGTLLLFADTFLNLNVKSKRISISIKLLSLLVFSTAPFSLFAYGPFLAKMAGVIALSVPFIIFIVTIYSFKFDRRNSLIFLSAIFFFLTGSMIYSLKELGFFPYNFYTENMLMIGSVFEIALFSIALGEKFKLIQLENANKEVELLKEKQQRTEIEITNSRNSLIAEYASQVAHDIRSPLSALTMVAGTLTDIPEEKRVMIRNATQRINDIANGLLQKGKMIGKDKGASEAQSNSVIEKSIEFIPALVDILVSEKRMQFREHNDLEIVTDLKNSFGSFAIINSTELKRVLSNLINNAVEAFDNFKGTITVGVQKITTTTGSHVEIFVSDNGKGIPEHLINKLGQIGVSHGKASSGQSGSGLGLYHAKQTAESFSGKLEISSTEGKGSVIKFILPLADAPKWFAQKIDLSGKKYLVSLDDDSSIHQIWTERLQSLASDPLFKNIEHIKFQSGEAFEKYVNAHINMMKETLFLVDFELLNQPKTGLDWIEDLAIEKHAILVTSRYEEKDIQVRAARLNLQLLPKSLAGFVPFEIQKPKLKFDAVLLDDDDLVIATWRMAAKDRSKSILCFANRDELFAKLSEIDHNCAFYVDENLGNGLKGEFVTKELFDLGFKNLHLATGYPSDQFKHVTWVKSIVGKDPVFD